MRTNETNIHMHNYRRSELLLLRPLDACFVAMSSITNLFVGNPLDTGSINWSPYQQEYVRARGFMF